MLLYGDISNRRRLVKSPCIWQRSARRRLPHKWSRSCLLFGWRLFRNRVVNKWNRLSDSLVTMPSAVPTKHALDRSRDDVYHEERH